MSCLLNFTLHHSLGSDHVNTTRLTRLENPLWKMCLRRGHPSMLTHANRANSSTTRRPVLPPTKRGGMQKQPSPLDWIHPGMSSLFQPFPTTLSGPRPLPSFENVVRQNKSSRRETRPSSTHRHVRVMHVGMTDLSVGKDRGEDQDRETHQWDTVFCQGGWSNGRPDRS